MQSFLFDDSSTLGAFMGRIEVVLEKRVRRRLDQEMVNFAVYLEAQGLLEKFKAEPMPFDAHSRGQNQYLINLTKIKKPSIPYLKYILKNLLEEVANEPEKEQRTEPVG